MIDYENLTDEQKDYMNDLIFECATEAGFWVTVDSEDCAVFSAGQHGEIDVTEKVYAFAVHMMEQLNIMGSSKQ